MWAGGRRAVVARVPPSHAPQASVVVAVEELHAVLRRLRAAADEGRRGWTGASRRWFDEAVGDLERSVARAARWAEEDALAASEPDAAAAAP